jgi:hypothetical protein
VIRAARVDHDDSEFRIWASIIARDRAALRLWLRDSHGAWQQDQQGGVYPRHAPDHEQELGFWLAAVGGHWVGTPTAAVPRRRAARAGLQMQVPEDRDHVPQADGLSRSAKQQAETARHVGPDLR